MEIPQAMLFDWAKRLDWKGRILDTDEVAKVRREIRTYAFADIPTQYAIRQFFFNREES